ncbi:hypothetical protein [Burkholderia ambifaria]|uniref:hypothetical protein n=1 Tax=Burkholderia ambifaria TaxID=152480 RepID=UPI000F802D6B|nr:hypothetical protein [Burkholderia ambifaria]
MDGITDLRHFIDALPDSEVRGNAARQAASTLLGSWTDRIDGITEDNLLKDVDAVISHLQAFREKAKRVLPSGNGGILCLLCWEGEGWWEDDEAAAFKQGWRVTPVHRSLIVRDGPGFDIFATDEDALAFVKARAAAGDARAIKALKFHEHGLTVPPEPPRAPIQEYGELNC